MNMKQGIARTVAGDDRQPCLTARPEPLGMNPAETAVIVVDMQNAYASPGGYVDLQGFDISGAREVIDNVAAMLKSAREAGIAVVFLQNGWDPQLKEAGGPGSPNYYKSNALKLMRRRPELRGNCSPKAAGITSWWTKWPLRTRTSWFPRAAIPASGIHR